ncbi:4'-phosphopantetheinyl transferase superfamily protein [Aestuariibacter sp. AA17]|uniref:Enterobactin synthase component D n=1 Tax=Fluctibacter corallii TaxID=2984329 RepID=A0ABT3A4Y6_9ALTE|nr:4'-phosphopantetheinyl transferase superfamily protein [Aestuariibacter sp. AA17]MCV2883739.1 4'-phosphopantetheinyl transferase superfamily protein [Aestuariibacter sp. AA17]
MFELLEPCAINHTENAFITKITANTLSEQALFLVDCTLNPEGYRFNIFSEEGICCPESVSVSVAKRQAEFLSGRYAAKYALKLLDMNTPTTVPIGDHRAPVWPTGICGAITHNSKRAICVVAKRSHISHVGIDIEGILPLNTAIEIGSQIHTDEERAKLVECSIDRALATTLLFSAKESLFKAIYPQVKCYFGFECAQLIHVDLPAKCLTFGLERAFTRQYNVDRHYQVYFEYDDNLVKTMAVK